MKNIFYRNDKKSLKKVDKSLYFDFFSYSSINSVEIINKMSKSKNIKKFEIAKISDFSYFGSENVQYIKLKLLDFNFKNRFRKVIRFYEEGQNKPLHVFEQKVG